MDPGNDRRSRPPPGDNLPVREPIEDLGSSRSKRVAPRDEDQRSPDREVAGGLNGSLWSLQQAAGNTAVTELLGGLPAPQPLRVPGAASSGVSVAQRQLAPGDELMPPDAGGPATSGPAASGTAPAVAGAGAAPAAATPAAAPGAGAPSFEAALFEASLTAPLRAAAAATQADAPDHEVALGQIARVGPTLKDYEDRYTGRDDVVASRLFAVRGWLGPVVRELRARLGSVAPMTDKEIASRMGDVVDEVTAVGGRGK